MRTGWLGPVQRTHHLSPVSPGPDLGLQAGEEGRGGGRHHDQQGQQEVTLGVDISHHHTLRPAGLQVARLLSHAGQQLRDRQEEGQQVRSVLGEAGRGGGDGGVPGDQGGEGLAEDWQEDVLGHVGRETGPEVLPAGLHGEPPHLDTVRHSLPLVEGPGVLPVLAVAVYEGGSEGVAVVESHLLTETLHQLAALPVETRQLSRLSTELPQLVPHQSEAPRHPGNLLEVAHLDEDLGEPGVVADQLGGALHHGGEKVLRLLLRLLVSAGSGEVGGAEIIGRSDPTETELPLLCDGASRARHYLGVVQQAAVPGGAEAHQAQQVALLVLRPLLQDALRGEVVQVAAVELSVSLHLAGLTQQETVLVQDH